MKRLEAVYSMIEKTGILADIGCDHGLVSKYVLDNNFADMVYATDISQKSLQKAQVLLSHYHNIEFLVGDGLQPLKEVGVRPQTLVICGMGGETILGMLKDCDYYPTLILGAQKNIKLVRQFLTTNNYAIKHDFMVDERGKFYDIIKAEKGDNVQLDDIEARFGVFYKNYNPSLKKYIEKLLNDLSFYKDTEDNILLKTQAEEVYKWQKSEK